MEEDDAFLWLEAVQGERALTWVVQENRRTAAAFAQGDDFAARQASIQIVMDRPGRVPWASRHGEHCYNLWQDPDHPLGLWRRTTPAGYRLDAPPWETVLDLDALCAQEGRHWTLAGVEVLEPQGRSCLLSLSDNGADAVVIREFDLFHKCFVEDGFYLPEGKGQVSWISQDEIFVTPDVGPDSLSTSGYPRTARRWRRGTPLAHARLVHEVAREDVGIMAYHDPTPGWQRDVVVRLIDSRLSETFLLDAQQQLVRIEVPRDASVQLHRRHLLVVLGSDWEIDEERGGHRYQQGSLLAIDLQAFLAGERGFASLLVPNQRQVVDGVTGLRDHCIVSMTEDVSSRLLVFSEQDGQWRHQPLDMPGALLSIAPGSLDHHSNQYQLQVSSFLQPRTLYEGDLDIGGAPTLLKQESAFFDARGLEVKQYFAPSGDGTRVPYFQVSARGLVPDGTHPTLLYGYGGFEVSLTPDYLDAGAAAWLARGGVYVVANIRGGGEYGPRWHQAALRENRQCAYQDFAAVAQDLVARGVTTPARLGARGGSNGGLLIGNMLVHYPQLFGCLICEVPLLDMRRYTQLAAGSSWIGEYGDPDLPQDWAFLRAFSPFHQLRGDASYPPLLLLTATGDDRTHPAHARKMAARMRQMGFAQVYFHESDDGGHGGATSTAPAAFDEALVGQFLWHHLGRQA